MAHGAVVCSRVAGVSVERRRFPRPQGLSPGQLCPPKGGERFSPWLQLLRLCFSPPALVATSFISTSPLLAQLHCMRLTWLWAWQTYGDDATVGGFTLPPGVNRPPPLEAFRKQCLAALSSHRVAQARRALARIVSAGRSRAPQQVPRGSSQNLRHDACVMRSWTPLPRLTSTAPLERSPDPSLAPHQQWAGAH